jgi:dinuclear metal center YbgI/SA1388 family protein
MAKRGKLSKQNQKTAGKKQPAHNLSNEADNPDGAATLQSVLDYLDAVIPPHLAEPWDKVGLLVGPRRQMHSQQRIRHILVALDLTAAVRDQCLAESVDLLICYHPPIFKPLDRLCVQGDTPADLALELAQNRTWIYSPHTALDAAALGTNDVLAAALGLAPRGSLMQRRPPGKHLKLVTFVPEKHVEEVAAAVFDAGAGTIGEFSHYTQCSFRTPGTGTFFGDDDTSPAVGTSGQLEFVREIRFETIVPEARIQQVVSALRRVHPYEEPAYDLLVMESEKVEPGMGRIADLPAGETVQTLARRCKINLGLKTVQVLGDENHHIKTVGIVAGSCSTMPLQCGLKLDCVITGELKHHDMLAFQAAGVSAIMLGHAASEQPVLSSLCTSLNRSFPDCHSAMAKAAMIPSQF